MDHLIFSAMIWIVSLLFFSKDGLGIKLPTKVDMPLNKETKPNPQLGIKSAYSKPREQSGGNKEKLLKKDALNIKSI